MADLYKGIAGSPITYLAADISANQTTISIADDSALPDAPNICTIGYGEHLETIKYENKSNGVLQNVTRGIEGTPRAWPAGTEVARFFTAYDHNSIIENFNSHLAESVSELVLVDRDLSLTGTQTVTTTTQKDIKSIIAFGQVSDTRAFSIALADKTKTRGTVMYGASGTWSQESKGLTFSRVGGSSTKGAITNLGKGKFDIIWSHTGDGATGTGVCKFLVQFHGE